MTETDEKPFSKPFWVRTQAPCLTVIGSIPYATNAY